MSERKYAMPHDLPVAVTPLSGDELAMFEQDGQLVQADYSALVGETAAHEETHQRGGADAVGTLEKTAYAIPYLDADGLIDTRVSDATASVKGKVQLATDGEEDAAKAVTGTDSRLSDARAPTAHASQHIAGTDPIATATTSNAGLMSAADKVKADATTPAYIPTAEQKAALVGTSGTPSSSNAYVTEEDPLMPTSDEKDAMTGTAGTPSLSNPFVTTTDPRFDEIAAEGFSVFSEEQETGQTTRSWTSLTSYNDELYATVYGGDIYKMDEASIFQPTGQTSRAWQGIAQHDGDLYATVSVSGDIYKMDGSGVFQATGQTTRAWNRIASHDGELYATVYNGDIYKMDGSGVFQATGQTTRAWNGIASHDGELYACADGGNIYKMDGSGIFQTTSQTSRNWQGIASHDGDLYAGANAADLYKMDGAGVFQPTGQTGRDRQGIASHAGELYACTTAYDIYKYTTKSPSVNITKTNYTIPISSTWPLNGKKVFRRLAAYDGNAVTISPPSGATFEGMSSITLYGQYSYVELERISATVFAIKRMREQFTNAASQRVYKDETGSMRIVLSDATAGNATTAIDITIPAVLSTATAIVHASPQANTLQRSAVAQLTSTTNVKLTKWRTDDPTNSTSQSIGIEVVGRWK